MDEHLDHLTVCSCHFSYWKEPTLILKYVENELWIILASFEILKDLPLFYKEFFIYFNQRKKNADTWGMNINYILQ